MTDSDLIQRVLDGDREAFGPLVDRHHDRGMRIAWRILGNREDAEEAVQDAFVRAYVALGSYEHRERFEAWLACIVVNQCRTALARRRRRDDVLVELDATAVAFASRLQQGAHDWDDRDDRDDWPALAPALARLPAAQREAVVLRYAGGLTFEEMAQLTGCGTSALKMRVQRAFAQLRDLLRETSSVR
jgi:RNA polymerase sigma-70 factor (ECF subfamily)